MRIQWEMCDEREVDVPLTDMDYLCKLSQCVWISCSTVDVYKAQRYAVVIDTLWDTSGIILNGIVFV